METIHYLHSPEFVASSACGAIRNSRHVSARLNITNMKGKVTCSRCKKTEVYKQGRYAFKAEGK